MRWQRVVAKLRSSTYLKDAGTLTLGTAVAQFLALLTVPILARQYSPAAFGVLAAFLAVGSVVATAATLRYENAILLPPDPQEAQSLVLLSMGLTLCFGALGCLGGALMPSAMKHAIGLSALGGWLSLAIMFGVTNALAAVGTAWLNRNRAYARMAALKIAQTMSNLVMALALGAWGLADGLIVAQIAASLLVALVISIWLPRAVWALRSVQVWNAAKKHSAAPKYWLVAALLDTVTLQIPVILISHWFGTTEAGQFSMAWRVLGIPVTLLGSAVGQVFLQRFSQAWPNAKLAKSLLLRTWALLACVGILPIGVLMLFGEYIFALALGPTWRSAGQLAVVMAPMLFFMLVSSPTSGACMVLGLQKMGLAFGLAFVAYRTLAIYIGFRFDSLVLGLMLWVIFEVMAILVYNMILVNRMDRP